MPLEDSETHWLRELKGGDERAAQMELWDRYSRQVVALARQTLGKLARRAEDEEDVAISVMNSFFEGVRDDRFPLLQDRSGLWPLLAKITVRKAISQRRRQLAQRRGGGAVRGESVFISPDSSNERCDIEDVPGSEPTPAFAESVRERIRQLLERLDDDTLRFVALRKLEGFQNAEIAAELDCVSRTVERKLDRIRKIWSAELED